MQPLTAPLRMRRADPDPGRLAYRAQRLWLTPLVRPLLRTGLPAFAVAFLAMLYLSNDQNWAQLRSSIEVAQTSVQERAEYQIRSKDVVGASALLTHEVSTVLESGLQDSSLAVDLDAVRHVLEQLPGVDSAVVRLQPGGRLVVEVEEVMPAAVLLEGAKVSQISLDGHHIRTLKAPPLNRSLPVLAGTGAAKNIDEALQLMAALQPLRSEVKGLVRVGERRWTVELSRDRQIALPDQDPLAALQRVLVLADTQAILERDVAVIDFRNPRRPTVRMTPEAVTAMRAGRSVFLEGFVQ